MNFSSMFSSIKKVVFIEIDVLKLCLCTIVSKGHLLIEDVPGVGKTTLAKGLANILGLTTKRIQFTNDMLPSDILGYYYFDSKLNKSTFKPGPIFTNILLADEINRASPRTQSALLEVMEERTVSVEGFRHLPPDPFFVIATQNPFEHAGTFPLPQSQLDRFSCRISLGYPKKEFEARLIAGENESAEKLKAQITKNEIVALVEQTNNVHVSKQIIDYILRLCVATREHPSISLGISPRGGIIIKAMAQAWAMIDGRDYVVSDDIVKIFSNCASHRIITSNSEQTSGEILKSILTDTEIP